MHAKIPGNQASNFFAGDGPDETEFVTIMKFDSLESGRAFAGNDHEAAVVPPKARAVLALR